MLMVFLSSAERCFTNRIVVLEEHVFGVITGALIWPVHFGSRPVSSATLWLELVYKCAAPTALSASEQPRAFQRFVQNACLTLCTINMLGAFVFLSSISSEPKPSGDVWKRYCINSSPHSLLLYRSNCRSVFCRSSAHTAPSVYTNTQLHTRRTNKLGKHKNYELYVHHFIINSMCASCARVHVSFLSFWIGVFIRERKFCPQPAASWLM